jgi:hypothetical protein
MPGPTSVSSSRVVPAPIDETYLRTIELPLPELFSRRYLAVPAVTRVDQHDPGSWGTVGQTRTIHLGGGGSMLETLTRCDRPEAFGYDITEVRGALSPLVERIEGTYSFEKAGTGTRVTWSWRMHPKGPLGAAGLPVFARMWRGYARQALEQLERSLV